MPRKLSKKKRKTMSEDDAMEQIADQQLDIDGKQAIYIINNIADKSDKDDIRGTNMKLIDLLECMSPRMEVLYLICFLFLTLWI